MKAPEQAFRFTSELGRRLRELRVKAGLSQAQLALRMGRHVRNIVSRLELGKPKFPTIGLVADYLAACEASFKDISDLLDRPAAEKPRRRRKPKSVEQQLELVRKRAAPLQRQSALEQWLYSVVKTEGMPERFVDRKKLICYGRKVFSRMEKDRKAELAERKELVSSGASEDAAREMEAAVEVYFRNLAESGDLDRDFMVDADAVVAGRTKLPKVKRADERLEEELGADVRYWRNMRYYTSERIKNELLEPLRELGYENPGIYVALVPDFCAIAEETAPGSPERTARTEARVAKVNDKQGVRRMAQMVYELYEKYKSNIPARPRDWDAPIRLYRPGR